MEQIISFLSNHNIPKKSGDEKNNITSIKWKTKSDSWVTISITDAYQISYLATQKIQNIYIG